MTDEGVKGLVTVSELMGSSSHLHATVEGKDVIAVIPTEGVYKNYMNQELTFGFNGNVVHIFSKDTEKNLEFDLEVTASEFKLEEEPVKEEVIK